MKLTISIVLYNTPTEQVCSLLSSLILIKIPYKLHVIDNSPESSLNVYFQNTGADYLHLPHNPGYGAAHNVAIERALRGGISYHIVMNADVSFTTDVITPMIEFMETRPEVGQMMPKVLNPDGSIQRLCKLVPSPFDLFARRFLPFNLQEKFAERFELHEFSYDKRMFVPFLSGCFMLLRLKAIREVGSFDERFFMYAEDIDLTRRVAEKYDTLFFPDCSVVHAHEGASRKSLKMFFIHVFSAIKYFNKWGWIHDHGRNELNKKTLIQLNKIE